MADTNNLIDNYLTELTLVDQPEEGESALANAWKNVANDTINAAINAGKVDRSRCIAGCRDVRCKQTCDLRSTTLVLRALQAGITRCRGDRRCVKAVANRIVNIAQRGDEKVRKYGFGVPYLRAAIDFVSRFGFQVKQ